MKNNTFWFRILSIYEHYIWQSESDTTDDRDVFKNKAQKLFNFISNELEKRNLGLMVMLHSYVMLTNIYILDREKHLKYAEQRAHYFTSLLFLLNTKELTT